MVLPTRYPNFTHPIWGPMKKAYAVLGMDTSWCFIAGPDGYREGPYRYRWEAEEYAEKLNSGELKRDESAVDINEMLKLIDRARRQAERDYRDRMDEIDRKEREILGLNP